MMENVDSQMNNYYLIQGRAKFDAFRNEIVYGDSSYKLAYSDAKVLFLLINANSGEVTRESILEYAWQGRVVTEASLTTSISNLRKILRACDINEDGILTVPKVGYKLTLDIKMLSSNVNEGPLSKATFVQSENKYHSIIKKIPLFNFLFAFFIFLFAFYDVFSAPPRSTDFISSEYQKINKGFNGKQYKLLVRRNHPLPEYLTKFILLSPGNSFIYFREEGKVVSLSYFFNKKSKAYTFKKSDLERAYEVVHDTIND